ncbi:hypothetical protein GTY65_27850 [Streptomyces sp. SID8379]|nr:MULTISPECIES: hypothetical protein [unclassified Streptomyces]MYW67859.1 hypothetical protein [Streptomyces sp. SID8379]
MRAVAASRRAWPRRRPGDEPAIALWVKHLDDVWALASQEPGWRRAEAA